MGTFGAARALCAVMPWFSTQNAGCSDMRGELICPHCGEKNADDRALCGACSGALRPKQAESASGDSEPGRYLGRMISQRYRVVERIARGGMGEVYVAEHLEMRQLVAVKFLHKRYAHDESFAARFFNEARYAAQVTHPNAVALYDFGRLDDGTLFIVMEYVRGEALSRVVRAQKMIPVPMAIRVASQVAEVLASAHEKRIIHRDVKPDNIMLVQGAGGRVAVKVLDFGIAKILDDEDGHHTEPGVMFGTPEYMSPEQAMGRPYDHRVDVYALGLVLYYMLIGRPPFTGSNKMAVLQSQVQDTPPSLERGARQPIPKRLVRLIDSMLSKSPDDRPSDMIEVFNELDSILAADELEADIIESIPMEAAAAYARATTREASPRPEPSTASLAEEAARVKGGTKPLTPYRVARLAEEEAALAPIRRQGEEESYTLTGVDLVVPPLKMGRETSPAKRGFRVESGWLLTGVVALCSFVVFVVLGLVVRGFMSPDAPVEEPLADVAIAVDAPLADAAAEAEAQAEGTASPDGDAELPDGRYGAQIAEATRALEAGDLRAANGALAAIPVTDAPPQFAPLRQRVVRGEVLLRDLELALRQSRCDDARTHQHALRDEVSAALAGRHENAVQSCADRVAAANASVPSRAPDPTPAPARAAATPTPAPTPARAAASTPTPAPTPTPTPTRAPEPTPTRAPDPTPTPAAPATAPTALPGDVGRTPEPAVAPPAEVLPPMEL